MPKLPRGNGKATTEERAKKPAAKPAAATTARSTTKKPAAQPPKKKAPAGRGNGRAKAGAGADFRHRPVDRHTAHEPAGPATKLTGAERVLLGDLFAVVEEHAGESVESIDRELV
jgi:hypothetical protein